MTTTHRRMPTPPNTAGQFAHLETQVGSVATQLSDYIKDSKEYRDRIERDQMQIWAAIKDQGQALQTAVDRLSNAGRISWPGIVATVGLVLSVSAAAAAIGKTLVDAQIRQNQIQIEHMEKEMDRAEDRFNRFHDFPAQPAK